MDSPVAPCFSPRPAIAAPNVMWVKIRSASDVSPRSYAFRSWESGCKRRAASARKIFRLRRVEESSPQLQEPAPVRHSFPSTTCSRSAHPTSKLECSSADRVCLALGSGEGLFWGNCPFIAHSRCRLRESFEIAACRSRKPGFNPIHDGERRSNPIPDGWLIGVDCRHVRICRGGGTGSAVLFGQGVVIYLFGLR